MINAGYILPCMFLLYLLGYVRGYERGQKFERAISDFAKAVAGLQRDDTKEEAGV